MVTALSLIAAVGQSSTARAAGPDGDPAEDNGWGSDDEVAPATEPTLPAPAPAPVVASPTPTAAPPPVPTPHEEDLRRRVKAGEGTAIAGYVFLGSGAVALLLLAVPALAAASVARDRAGDDPLLTTEDELIGRAQRRERFAKISALAGLGGLVVGGALIGAGLGTKSRAERELNAISRQRTATVSPYLPRGGGLGLSLGGRF